MEEERFLCLCIVLLFLIEMGWAFNRRGPWWGNDTEDFGSGSCVSILTTDLDIDEDFGTSAFRFKDAKELLKLKKSPQFLSPLSSISCLITVSEPDNSNEVLELIHMVNKLPVLEKYMLLIGLTYDETAFENLTINFQVKFNYTAESGEITII